MLPVAHLYDSAARADDVRYAASLHSGQTILRLGSDTHDPDDAEAEEALDRLRGLAGLAVEQCHLVLDLFEVRSERDLIRAEPVVRKCLSWARRYPWSSITVAAGAMPQRITHIPVNTPTPVHRWDLELWQRTRDLGVQYADYGIAHPAMSAAGWRPMPSLRYTTDDAWWIYRWRDDMIDRSAVYELCKALVASDHWPTEGGNFSWGDHQVSARAQGIGGPGNASSWRAPARASIITHRPHWRLFRQSPYRCGRTT